MGKTRKLFKSLRKSRTKSRSKKPFIKNKKTRKFGAFRKTKQVHRRKWNGGTVPPTDKEEDDKEEENEEENEEEEETTAPVVPATPVPEDTGYLKLGADDEGDERDVGDGYLIIGPVSPPPLVISPPEPVIPVITVVPV